MSGRQGLRRMGIVIVLNKYNLGQEMKFLFFLLSLSLIPATVYIVPYERQGKKGDHSQHMKVLNEMNNIKYVSNLS